MVLPVAVVLVVRRRRPHAGRVEREGGIPVGDRLLVAHAFHFGDEIPGHCGPAHGGDPGDAERRGRLLDAAVQRLGQEGRHRQPVADRHGHALGGEIVGQPTVDEDLVGAGRRQGLPGIVDQFARRVIRGVDAEDGRVGDAGRGRLARRVERPDVVGEEHERRPPAHGPEHLLRDAIDLRREDEPPAREPQHARRGGLERESDIGQSGAEMRLQPGRGLAPRGHREQGVDGVVAIEDRAGRLQ